MFKFAFRCYFTVSLIFRHIVLYQRFYTILLLLPNFVECSFGKKVSLDIFYYSFLILWYYVLHVYAYFIDISYAFVFVAAV